MQMFWTLLSAALIAVASADEQTDAAHSAITPANNAFSVDLYQALSNATGNFVVSPLSLGALLSLVYLGAGGNTAAQLKAALHLPDDPAQVTAGFKALIESSQNNVSATIRIANKAYLQKDFNLLESFNQTAMESFGSEAEEVDFHQNTEDARLAINNWVMRQTDYQIRNLFQKGDLTTSTVMVLANAIYFKGVWQKIFNELYTERRSFYLADNTEITVPFMTQTDTFRTGTLPSLNARVLELPYQGDEFKMLVLVPDAVDGLSALEAGLSQVDFTEIANTLSQSRIRLSLPKFKIENTHKMGQILSQKLHITDIFTHTANLTGISDHELQVGKVVQKVSIEVMETGTEFQVITDADMFLPMATMPPHWDIRVDRAFLFVLLDRNGAVWFLGRCVSPA